MAILWGSTWWAVVPCRGQLSSELGLPTADSADPRPDSVTVAVETALVPGVSTAL